MKYDAFISYRHTPLDMEVAKKLHKALETYHIPPAVQKRAGKKRINRVFRDQEELPIGSDLSDKINDALKEAEYLIVICSPNTPESDWVLKEIETFIELHDREHILAVMIDGEPSESFPTPLLTDDEGKSVEPLAADIRGKDARERNSKFKTEFLRLAAPIIGCTYDDLKQRHKERIIRRNITIGAIAAGAIAIFGTVFGVYNAHTASEMKKLAEEKENLANEKTQLADEILEEYRLKQINQSRFLAEKSRTLFRQGQREDAILVAMEALPNKDVDRPVVSEAEYALSEALYAYDLGYSFGFDRTLSHECAVNSTFLSSDETKILSIDQNRNLYVWDIKTRSLLTKIPPHDLGEETSYSIYMVDASTTNIYVQYTDCLIKYDYSGNIISTFSNLEEFYVIADFDFENNQAFVASTRKVYLLNLDTMEPVKSFENPSEDDFSIQGFYSPDKETFIIRFSSDVNDPRGFAIVNPEADTIKDIYPKDAAILELSYTAKGNIALLCSNTDHLADGWNRVFIDLYSTDGSLLWSKDLSTDIINAYSITYELGSHFYTADGDSEIVLAFQSQLFAIDEESAEIRSSSFLPSLVSGMFLYPNSNFSYLSTLDGEIVNVDLSSGMVYSEYSIQTETSIHEFYASTKENAFLFLPYSSTEIHVMSKHPCKNAERLTTLEKSYLPIGVSPSGDYYVLRDVDTYNVFDFFDGEGNLLYSYQAENGICYTSLQENAFYIATSKQIAKIDPIKEEVTTYVLSDYGITPSTGINGVSFARDGEYCVMHAYKTVYAFDLTEGKLLLAYEANEENDSIGGCAISSDGKKVLYNTMKGETFHILDIESASETTVSYLPTSLVNSSRFFDFSGDGKYYALCCNDGYLRLFLTSDNSVAAEIPFGIAYNFYFGFTADSTKLILQRDDNSVSFYDIESNTYVNNFSASYQIQYTVADEDNHMMAFYNGYDMYLVSTEDYGVLAYVPGCFVYSKKDQSFITRDGKTLVKMPYRNYLGLIIEAKEEFPNSVLSEEKKVKYNIE